MKRRVFLLGLIASPALALDPTEMLDDPALESRARTLDHEIRCVKCQSETVASSNAEWATDARRTIRELIAEGKSGAEVKTWFVERYGEYVLMDPPKTGSTLALWLAGPVMLGTALFSAAYYIRNRSKSDPAEALSAEEKARLDEILKE